MTSTQKQEDIVTEIFDDEKTLQSKMDVLINLIKKSKHCVIYTGAGISTSAGIPDYRGPTGIWTMREKGITKEEQMKLKPKLLHKPLPTFTHMSIAELYSKGYVKLVCSQNVDGLHLASGIPREKMSEIHGNTNIELCTKCNKEYVRDFSCRNHDNEVLVHKTGRFCDDCGTELEDSIVNFGDTIPDDQFDRALEHARKSDLAIVLGTSLRVKPACDIPEETNGKLVIVNLQPTGKDYAAHLKIHAKVDDVMQRLMTALNLKPKPYIYTKLIQFEMDEQRNFNVFCPIKNHGLRLAKQVACKMYGKEEKVVEIPKAPITVPNVPQDVTKIDVRIRFFLPWKPLDPELCAKHDEAKLPNTNIFTHSFVTEKQKEVIQVEYNTQTGEWKIKPAS